MKRHDYLKRLSREYYQGHAYVHWSLTLQDRKTGWLTPVFYYKFREILTHTTFRYAITCPIFCCMPDHIHLMWLGLSNGSSDQLNAMKYFRLQLNDVLRKIDFELQTQGFDSVLDDDERERTAFEDVCEYIARNPERKGLVEPDRFMDYRFTNCLVPGAPELNVFESTYWESFWRIYTASVQQGLQRLKVYLESQDFRHIFIFRFSGHFRLSGHFTSEVLRLQLPCDSGYI